MSESIYQDARAIGAYAAGKVAKLQAMYLGGGSAATAARASLARLRRLDTPGGGAWVITGGEIFEDLPDLDLSVGDERKMLRAVKATLKLYAIHQQSKQKPMAVTERGGDAPTGSRRSFGWSCGGIKPRLENAKGVIRRLSSIESAKDFDGIEYGLRCLITLMKPEDVRVDYYQLARDLYLLQFDFARQDVFMRWSRDFYAEMTSAAKTAGNGEDSSEKE